MLSYVLHNLGGGFGFVMLTRVARAQPAATKGAQRPSIQSLTQYICPLCRPSPDDVGRRTAVAPLPPLLHNVQYIRERRGERPVGVA